MTLITRVVRLFKADVHGLLDCIEEPRAVLKQAVREMEQEVQRKEAELVDLARQETATHRRKAEVERTKAEMSEQIKLCFRAGDEPLAKAGIRRKLEADGELRALERIIAELAGRKAELTSMLKDEREALADISHRADLFSHETCERKSIRSPSNTNVRAVTDEEVELAYLSEREAQEGL